MAKAKKKKEELFFDLLTCTDCSIYPVIKDGKTKALARVILNDQLALTGLRVIEGANGLFVAYPADAQSADKEYHSVYYPLNKELRLHIEDYIIRAYLKTINAKT